jgi:Domain of unknown function DUF29.
MSCTIIESYKQDFYAWAMRNAELIRQKRFLEVDAEHIAEELECMGKSEKRELISRLTVLLVHLLKWQFQPERHGSSWIETIVNQRREIQLLLEDSPSLRFEIDQRLERTYMLARQDAAQETGIDKKQFPEACPYSFAQAMDADFWPG